MEKGVTAGGFCLDGRKLDKYGESLSGDSPVKRRHTNPKHNAGFANRCNVHDARNIGRRNMQNDLM